MSQYFNAMAAVQRPTLAPDDIGQDFSYMQSSKDASPLSDIKRIRRHEIAKANLRDEPLCLIPERQIEGLAGNALGDACNFEILQQ